MIDNYDSFTYNLVQYLEQLGGPVRVIRNDAATIEDIASWSPAGIVISPGPGTAGFRRHLPCRNSPIFRPDSDSWRLPWSSGHRHGFWR